MPENSAELCDQLTRNSAMARDFVLQLDAPILHRTFARLADLCDRAAAHINQLEKSNAAMRAALKRENGDG